MFSVTIREKSGQVYTFHFDKPEIMVGRVKGNDVILPKQNISKRHALVRVHGARFIVEDLGSTNGTYVNGHRIATPVEVGSEDKVYLGDFVMQYYDLGQPSHAADPDFQVDLTVDAGEPSRAGFLSEAAALDATVMHEGPLGDGADIDFGGTAAFGRGDDLDLGGAAHASFDDGGLDGAFGHDGFDALPVAAAFEAPEEATLAQLGDAASHARREIDAHRRAASAGVTSGEAVASTDPFAVDPLDDRMTGPIHGLTGALEAAATPALDVGVDLDFSLPVVEPELALTKEEESEWHGAPVFATASRAPVAASGHYPALAMLYSEAVGALASALRGDAAQLSDAEWTHMEEQVIAFVDDRAAGDKLGGDLDVERLKRDLIYELAGLGPLEALLDDATIETIEVNSFDAIWLLRQGERTASKSRFSSQAGLTAAAERLVRASGVTTDDASTWVDGTLADGTTIRVAWPPMCPTGPVLLIRKPRGDAPTLDDLVARAVVTAKAAEQLKTLLLAGRSIGLVGTAGAGRRTVLNALARHIPGHERIVVTEQGVRLHLEQPQVVRLDASAGIETVLGIAHRLRPDRILLGACGAEALMALIDRTCDGFAPWMGLLHGHTAADAIARTIHAHAVRFPGVGRDTASARAATALDILGVFSDAPDGPVLDQVVEVVRHGDELRAIKFED